MPLQKPHPSAFMTVLDALGVKDPAAAVFVGDRRLDDISGARAVGMRTVLRPNPMIVENEGADPDAVIESLPELLPLVDAWATG